MNPDNQELETLRVEHLLLKRQIASIKEVLYPAPQPAMMDVALFGVPYSYDELWELHFKHGKGRPKDDAGGH